jgi:hypothetical protein
MVTKLKFAFVFIFIASSTSSLMASKRILVDLTHQIAIAYQDGRVLFYGRISTGKEGRRTPTGSYHVREKDIDHVSNLWPQPNGGAKMHYMLRVTRDGVAMHLGPTPDYPASHGCIRMKDGFAQRMFAWAKKWTPVDIIGTPPAHSPAVALPAYATSKTMLRRSTGGGTGNPLDAVSSNPKLHAQPKILTTIGTKSSVAHKPKHLSALVALSTNPKHHIKKANKRPKLNKRKRSARQKRKKRNRHPNPLGAVSSH